MPRLTRTFFIHFPIYPKVYSPEIAVRPNTRLHLPSLAAPPSTSGPILQITPPHTVSQAQAHVGQSVPRKEQTKKD